MDYRHTPEFSPQGYAGDARSFRLKVAVERTRLACRMPLQPRRPRSATIPSRLPRPYNFRLAASPSPRPRGVRPGILDP